MSELRATARRAAQRAVQGSVQDLAQRGSSAGDAPSAADDKERPHVAVRPRAFSASIPAGGRSAAGLPNGASEPEKVGRQDRDLVAEALVRAAAPGSELVIPPGSRITPLARELAFERGVTFVTGRSAEPMGPAADASGPHRIAVGSDHGGFGLKIELLPLLRELGHRPADHGTDSASVSVDYPDVAQRVALEVSEGRADLGILIDGAGIGSAMVAGKIPGVRAANCWDERSARNAREHNHANLLTLGAGHLDLGAMRSVVSAFLQTPVGEGRHARRAAMLHAIEDRYLRSRELARRFDEGR